MKKPRPIEIRDGVGYVTLTKGFVAVVDEVDVPLVSGRCWCAHIKHKKSGRRVVYAQSRINGKLFYIHTVITNYPMTDHADGDGLNNRRYNLRETNHVLNARNSSGHSTTRLKGISFCDGKWRAQIKPSRNERNIVVGTYSSDKEAHLAYAICAYALFAENARVF